MASWRLSWRGSGAGLAGEMAAGPGARPLRWLFLSRVWPERNASAAGVRQWEFLRSARAQSAHVTFATPARRQDALARELAQELGVQACHVAINRAAETGRWLREEVQPDVVVFDAFVSEELWGWQVAEHAPGAMRVLDMQDLHSWRACRERGVLERGLSVAESFALEPSLGDERLARELGAALRCDLTVACGRAELDLLSGRLGLEPRKLAVAPLLFAPENMRSLDELLGFATRSDFCVLGSFRHAPNRDAVRWLRAEVWPRIRARLPTAKVDVWGSYLDKQSASLHSPPDGFFMRGTLPKLSRLEQYRVSLAPLRFGAGVKGKVIAALSHGTPVVTTPIGSESVGAWPGSHCVDAEQLAERAAALYVGEAHWKEAQQRGREALTVDLFTAPEGRAALARAVLARHRVFLKDRERDVTMAVLLDARCRATEFMARWIEAKETAKGSACAAAPPPSTTPATPVSVGDPAGA